jgi:alpha-ketoglutarate-dependent taurine dioxygenase
VLTLDQHSDITFEPVPSDYASLQIRTLPPVGGDTLWASAYEAYDRLSPAYQTFLEGLTATHIGQGFIDIAKRTNATMRENRGSPENVGQSLETVHPVIRTNPVTGWKGLFVNRGFTKRINGLTKPESDQVLEFLFEHISSVRGSIFCESPVVADSCTEP